MVVPGKEKRNDEKFCKFFFVCLSAVENTISLWMDQISTNLLINRIFF